MSDKHWGYIGAPRQADASHGPIVRRDDLIGKKVGTASPYNPKCRISVLKRAGQHYKANGWIRGMLANYWQDPERMSDKLFLKLKQIMEQMDKEEEACTPKTNHAKTTEQPVKHHAASSSQR